MPLEIVNQLASRLPNVMCDHRRVYPNSKSGLHPHLDAWVAPVTCEASVKVRREVRRSKVPRLCFGEEFADALDATSNYSRSFKDILSSPASVTFVDQE
jgi:hypothetical protein